MTPEEFTPIFDQALRDGVGDGTITDALADYARAIRAQLTAYQPPNAGIGPDGEQVFFSWDTGPEHFELEIFYDDTVEAFYLNLDTREDWMGEYVGVNLGPEVFTYLDRFWKIEAVIA